MIEWKDIPDYEGLYQVSTDGRVKSLRKNLILKTNLDRWGYPRITLRGKTFRVHLLMAMTFLGHKPKGTSNLVCDHINNIKSDNRIENLQLIPHRENVSKDRKGSSKYTGVTWCKHWNKWVAGIRVKGKRKFLGYFIDEYEAHLAYQEAKNKL